MLHELALHALVFPVCCLLKLEVRLPFSVPLFEPPLGFTVPGFERARWDSVHEAGRSSSDGSRATSSYTYPTPVSFLFISLRTERDGTRPLLRSSPRRLFCQTGTGHQRGLFDLCFASFFAWMARSALSFFLTPHFGPRLSPKQLTTPIVFLSCFFQACPCVFQFNLLFCESRFSWLFPSPGF